MYIQAELENLTGIFILQFGSFAEYLIDRVDFMVAGE